MTRKQLETRQTLRTAGSLFGTVRKNFGITQNELMSTREVYMGYTMLSRTERGDRTPEDTNIITLTKAYLSLDRDKFKNMIAHEDFQQLREGIRLSCDSSIEFYIGFDKENGTDHSEKIEELQKLKAELNLE